MCVALSDTKECRSVLQSAVATTHVYCIIARPLCIVWRREALALLAHTLPNYLLWHDCLAHCLFL